MNSFHQIIYIAGLTITSLVTLPMGALKNTSTNNKYNVQSGSFLNQSFINLSENKAYSPENLISPNPNSGYFLVRIPSEMMNAKGILEVTDLLGNKIYSSDWFPENGDKLGVELLGPQPGLHFLILISGNERLVTKFIIR